jgi:putrescine transport system permease protein
MNPQPQRSRLAGFVVWIPYAWLVAFFLLPFLIALKISLSQSAIAQPPYTPVFDLAAGWSGIRSFFAGLSLENFVFLASDPLYVLSYMKSLQIAAFSTLMLLVIGYPIAYAISRTPRRVQAVLVVLVILPFWTSFLIRIYAWMNILQHDGLLNQLLLAFHIVREPPAWLSTNTAVYIGIVYSYLPFMVLPLYAALEKLDESLLEAAADLGCPRWRTFWMVTLPLSAPGVVAGALLWFIPIVGEFFITDLLGG